MASSLLDKIFRRTSGTFIRAARARGVRARAAKTLEPAAREISPEDPERILDSRELFEQAAARAVIGEAGNLELCFGLVDLLATTVETLGLARSSDVPDPFRRVWIKSESGVSRRGVVYSCEGGEIAVFCPPASRPVFTTGSVLKLGYRSFGSSVRYDLRLNDAVCLPGAIVLHLTRLEGTGTIGRAARRFPVSIHAKVLALRQDEVRGEGPAACQVVDISATGLCIQCDIWYVEGQRVWLELPLPDGTEELFRVQAVIRWSRVPKYGMEFVDLPQPLTERLERFLSALAAGVTEEECAPSGEIEMRGD